MSVTAFMGAARLTWRWIAIDDDVQGAGIRVSRRIDAKQRKEVEVMPSINSCMRASRLAVLIAGTVMLGGEALAQQPSQAQVNAIRQACRSDYMSHCSSVPPGGAAALNCLRQNVSSLSAGCQQAVNAIQQPARAPAAQPTSAPAAQPPAAPETPAAPATAVPPATEAATPPPAAAPPPAAPPAAASKAATAKAKRAELAKIRQACGADYRVHCQGIPPGGQASIACLQRNAPTLSSACRQVLAGVAGAAAPAAGAPPPAVVAAPAAPPPRAEPAPLLVSPREEMFILRTSCGPDYARFCRGLQFGGGRVVSCLHYYAASLSPRCQAALAALREGR